VQLVDERGGGRGAPAVSAGVTFRWQTKHIEDGLGVATENADVYGVVTKTFTMNDAVAILANGGLKMTNASLLGLAGNAPDWTAAGFVSGGVVIDNRVTVGGEFLQQPEDIEGIADADVPPTFTIFGRVSMVDQRLTLDAAWIRLAGEIAPGLDAHAENQLAVAVTYRF
jgi:hypothetical protein